MASRKARLGPRPASPIPVIPCLLLALLGCRENLSAPPAGRGPDLAGPVIRLAPAHDTLADSVGVLLVTLQASDVSGIRTLELELLPATASFGTLQPNDTAFAVSYPVPLALFKHGVFRFYARGVDILDHETVTDTVTVTVR
jgi:hypothetical protein